MPVKQGKEGVHQEMHKFKHGKLHSGKGGKVVTNPKQAIAIALHASGMSKRESTFYGRIKNLIFEKIVLNLKEDADSVAKALAAYQKHQSKAKGQGKKFTQTGTSSRSGSKPKLKKATKDYQKFLSRPKYDEHGIRKPISPEAEKPNNDPAQPSHITTRQPSGGFEKPKEHVTKVPPKSPGESGFRPGKKIRRMGIAARASGIEKSAKDQTGQGPGANATIARYKGGLETANKNHPNPQLAKLLGKVNTAFPSGSSIAKRYLSLHKHKAGVESLEKLKQQRDSKFNDALGDRNAPSGQFVHHPNKYRNTLRQSLINGIRNKSFKARIETGKETKSGIPISHSIKTSNPKVMGAATAVLYNRSKQAMNVPSKPTDQAKLAAIAHGNEEIQKKVMSGHENSPDYRSGTVARAPRVSRDKAKMQQLGQERHHADIADKAKLGKAIASEGPSQVTPNPLMANMTGILHKQGRLNLMRKLLAQRNAKKVPPPT